MSAKSIHKALGDNTKDGQPKGEVVATFDSNSTPGRKYEVFSTDEGVLTCWYKTSAGEWKLCPAFKFAREASADRECKHIKAYLSEMADEPQ